MFLCDAIQPIDFNCIKIIMYKWLWRNMYIIYVYMPGIYICIYVCINMAEVLHRRHDPCGSVSTKRRWNLIPLTGFPPPQARAGFCHSPFEKSTPLDQQAGGPLNPPGPRSPKGFRAPSDRPPWCREVAGSHLFPVEIPKKEPRDRFSKELAWR